MPILSVSNLSVAIQNKSLFSDISFALPIGKTVVLMGPNGSGKSSLAAVLMGYPDYQLIAGDIFFKGQCINNMPIEKRARLGLFLAFQYPPACVGVKIISFLQEAYRAIHGALDGDISAFYARVKTAFELVGLDPTFAERSLHEGFSGGEKKRLELVQLIILRPSCAILDELDSGLDSEGRIRIVEVLHAIRQENPSLSLLIITHYAGFAAALTPQAVLMLLDGALHVS